jgi:hypothetical protein
MDLHAKIVGVISCAVSCSVLEPLYKAVNHITWSNVLIFSSAHISIPIRDSIFKNVTLTINKYTKNYEFK